MFIDTVCNFQKNEFPQVKLPVWTLESTRNGINYDNLMHPVPPEAKSSTFFNMGKYKMPSLINLSSVIYVDLDCFAKHHTSCGSFDCHGPDFADCTFLMQFLSE
jgi:hypothetical protein